MKGWNVDAVLESLPVVSVQDGGGEGAAISVGGVGQLKHQV